MRYFLFIFMLACSISIHALNAQNTRLSDHNAIGWCGYFGTFKLSQKWGIHTEYQLRRTHFITEPQQGLLRVGLTYDPVSNIQLRIGYAWAETFPYGEFAINGMGKDFTEHRIFQMVTLLDKIAIVDISHRFMLEQRWIGRYTNATLSREDDYPFVNRIRYMVRAQVPLKGSSVGDKTPYVAVYDELLIGFGKNINQNIFDQNRLGVLVGYRFTPAVRIEGGYLSQILQLGREVNAQNVVQYNNGMVVNANFTIDCTKKK